MASDGFLLLDKPAGMSSQQAVTSTRHALGAARAGHTGTLDPFATGLLVILTGSATRLARYVPAEPKVYDALIRFGTETDTDDVSGAPVTTAGLPDEAAVRNAIAQLTGRVEQVPPAYSAKQVAGRRAYAMARAGLAVELAAVAVDVQEWEVLELSEDTLHARITCGSGTYIRALARDLGRLAGSAGHLAALRRTRIGPFRVEDAVTDDRLAGAVPSPSLDLLAEMHHVTLDAQGERRVRSGMPIDATEVSGAESAALVNAAGHLVAVAEREQGRWQPRVVLPGA